MNVAVIDLGFGDAGKGRVVDWLASQEEYGQVIRYTGAHQSGHTVYKNGKHHVFQNIGSGALQGLPTFWHKRVPISPVKIIKEIKHLQDNFNVNPTLHIHPECHITTPYDVQANIIRANSDTVGEGIKETFNRIDNSLILQANDIIFPSVFKIKLKMIKEYYLSLGHEYDVNNYFISEFEESCSDIINFISDDNLKHFSGIYESSQGLMLNEKIGFTPHVSWGDLGSKHIKNLESVYYVTRAYHTRHGNGPISNHPIINGHIRKNIYETNEFNAFQGNFRTNVLDLDILTYAFLKDSNKLHPNVNKNIVITCCDIVDDFIVLEEGELRSFNNKYEFFNYIYYATNVDQIYYSDNPEGSIYKY